MVSKIPLWRCLTVIAVIMCAAFGLIVGGSQAGQAQTQPVSPHTVWSKFLLRQPYPYLIPLPESKRSDLDDTYVKVVAAKAERVHCLRCPEYAPEGGVWKLNLDRGVFRIFHPESGWKSIGTYIAAKDRVLLANDPACIDEIGLYRWQLADGRLIFEAIDDPCAIKLRAVNLTQQPWMSCRPPNIEAAVTEHWLKPEGCD